MFPRLNLVSQSYLLRLSAVVKTLRIVWTSCHVELNQAPNQSTCVQHEPCQNLVILAPISVFIDCSRTCYITHVRNVVRQYVMQLFKVSYQSVPQPFNIQSFPATVETSNWALHWLSKHPAHTRLAKQEQALNITTTQGPAPLDRKYIIT